MQHSSFPTQSPKARSISLESSFTGSSCVIDVIMLRFLLLFGGASAIDFLAGYLSEEFFATPIYNSIDCSESNKLQLTRLVSSSGHGFLSLHHTTEPLEGWVHLKIEQTFFLNTECPGGSFVLEQVSSTSPKLEFKCSSQANSLNLFSFPYRWLLLDSSIEDLEKRWYWPALKEYKLLLDSQVRILTRKDEVVNIFEVHKRVDGGELLLKELAEWSPAKGLNLLDRKCTAMRRWDVFGAPLPGTIVVTHEDTLNHLEDAVDKHIDSSTKVGYVVMKHFSEMINASFTLKVVNTWGVEVNGTWSGMVGDLQSGVSEVGVSPCFFLVDRMSVIEYYSMVTPTRTKFIFLSPPLSFSSNIFTMPFHKVVWLCCFTMVLISCGLLYLAIKLEGKEDEIVNENTPRVGRKKIGQRNELKESFSDILLLNIGAICLQGTVSEPKGPSGRIITLFLYFSYMFLYVSYSGSIVALLQSSDTSIRTFKDLLDSPLKVGADDIVYSQHYFKTETDPLRRALYNRKVAPKGEVPHFMTPEEGIKNVRKGLYAFHVEGSVGYSIIQKTFTEDEKCGLQVLKESFFQVPDPVLTMRLGSPFREHLRIGVQKIVEMGINSRSLSRIFTKKPRCSVKGSRFVSVGLMDCYHAFMILLYGTASAWFAVFFEKLLMRKWKNRSLNKALAESSHGRSSLDAGHPSHF